MNISSITAHAADPAVGHLIAVQPSTRKASEINLSIYAPLAGQQLKTLRAAVGYDFNWPPTADSGPFPLAAVVLSEGDMSGYIAAQKQLTAGGLRELGVAGFLSATGVARGTAYLQQGSSSASDQQASGVARPVSGTVAADGSVYL